MKSANHIALWTKRPHQPFIILQVFLFLYLVFLFHGALFPFHHWRLPQHSMFTTLLFDWTAYIFLFDIIQNLILFLPLGFFTSAYLSLQQKKRLYSLVLPTLLSFLTSLLIELIQTYNPARIPSLLDVGLNTLSGLMGALLAWPLLSPYHLLLQEAENSIYKGNKNNLWPFVGMATWVAWAFFQMYPFLPTLHPQQLFANISPVVAFFSQETPLDMESLCLYLLQGATIYFSGKLFLRPERFSLILSLFTVMVLMGKITVISYPITIEILLGCGGAIVLLLWGQKLVEVFSLPSGKMETVDPN